jgi:hypothetical protein
VGFSQAPTAILWCALKPQYELAAEKHPTVTGADRYAAVSD